MRRQIPLILVFITGAIMTIRFFIPSEFSGELRDFMNDWLVIIGIFAMALGIWSLVRVSVNKIKRKTHDWQYSIITLLGLFVMLFFGFQIPGAQYKPIHKPDEVKEKITARAETAGTLAVYLAQGKASQPYFDSTITALKTAGDSVVFLVSELIADEEWVLRTEEQNATLKELLNGEKNFSSAISRLDDLSVTDSLAVLALSGELNELSKASTANAALISELDAKVPFVGGQASYMFRQFFNHIMIPIQSTMFSLLAFFIASAAYRAFRARSVLASVLLAAALILMLRLLPLGPVTGFLNQLSSLILLVPNMAAKRAILMGVGLGMVATALKVVLGIERSYMGKD